MRGDIYISLILCIKESEWVKVTELCLTLCDPMHCSLPGSSVHGILQARILEWIAFPFSRVFPTQELNSGLPYGRFFMNRATREAQEYWRGCINETRRRAEDHGVCAGNETLQSSALTRLFLTLLRGHLLLGLLEDLKPNWGKWIWIYSAPVISRTQFLQGIYRRDSSLTIKNPVLK